ncbi:MAG TPA: cupin domain-containing protein [Actinomycetota bacterium]|nr:cupin domain-containing protein [Actinomycetota bacterium]
MAKASKASAPEHFEMEGFEGHYAELGGTTVGWETYTADADLTPLFRGLPDDRCQCEHTGYVFEGRLVFHTAEGDEEFVGGEAYVVGPGHTPVIYAGTSLVEFSPTDRLQETLEVVSKNMESASG